MNPGAEFDDFVRRASPQLLRTSFLLVHDRGHAEDLLQEALVRTARHWHAASAAPEAYTRRVIVDALRQLPYQQRAVAVLRYWEAMARLRELVSDRIEARHADR